MINISSSLITDFTLCPKRAYYRLRCPEVGIATPEQKVGTLVHKIIECTDNINDAKVMMNSGIIEYDLIGNENKIEQIIDNYFNNFQGVTSKGDLVEYKFTIPEGNYCIKGMIDRITPDFTILDWKTSAKAPQKLKNNVQFAIYKYAVRKVLNKEPGKMYCIYLARNKSIPVQVDDAYIDYLTDTIIPWIYKTIIENRFPKYGLISDYACDYCNFAFDCLQEVYGGPP